jgi:molecular chaperone GrpE
VTEQQRTDPAVDLGGQPGDDPATPEDVAEARPTEPVPSAAPSESAEPTEDADELGSHVADEITELASERDQFRDIAQRLQADFENYRKRVHAQIRDEADRSAARLAEALLPVLDATEAAYLRHPDEVGPLLDVMLTELRRQGLEMLHVQDQPFDPNVAEAVAHEPGEGGEVVVAEVLRSGYAWNGRTLRPAMVRTRD